jgi:Uma2 family endonuclease
MSTQNIPAAMTTQGPVAISSVIPPEDELHSGDLMTQEEFHRVYEQRIDDRKVELIEGIVYLASPATRAHGRPQGIINSLLFLYEGRTPGVEFSDNTTVILGKKNELQPDAYLRILPECGGQSKVNEGDYVVGSPELIAEVAYSSRAIDLHKKRKAYARHGVREYLVASVEERQLRWFDLAAGKELQPDAAGIHRIQTFPGLWINGPALLAQDHRALMQTLDEGLAAPEHAAFVEELAKRRAKV